MNSRRCNRSDRIGTPARRRTRAQHHIELTGVSQRGLARFASYLAGARLFNYLGRTGNDRGRHFNPDRSRGYHIYYEIKSAGLLYRKVGGAGTS